MTLEVIRVRLEAIKKNLPNLTGKQKEALAAIPFYLEVIQELTK